MAKQITFNECRALQAPVSLPTPQELLEFQVEKLATKGLIGYEQADPFRQDLPSGLFLLIPSRPVEINWEYLMSLVVVDGKQGRNYCDPAQMKDGIEVPPGPYLMEGVEDGNARRNKKPSENWRNILAEGRFPFTMHAGMIFAILFPEVLKHHFLDLVGSRYWPGLRPVLGISGAGPRLDACWDDFADSGWGAPSCLRRRAGNQA